MDFGGLATLISAVAGLVIGGLGWRLSARVQTAAIERQRRIDQGTQVEERAVFERELRTWLRNEIDAQRAECEQEKSALRKVIGYWRDLALGRIDKDATP